MSVLRYHLARPDARLEAAVAWAADVIGVRARPAVPPDLWSGPHLVHGDPAMARELGITIPDRPMDRFWDAALDGGPAAAPGDGAFSFDVIGAIAAFLGDADHADPDPAGLDDHGRLRLDASAPFLAGRGAVPVVNAYVSVLEGALAARGLTGRPRWPDGRRAAIALSHDVDRPDRYALLESAWRPWRFRRSPRGYVETTIGLIGSRLRDPDPLDQWRFEDVVAFERGLDVRSTFFFSVTPFHRPWADGVDVAYDAGTGRFRRVMRGLVDAGFEVGLHASYNAFESAARLRSERERLSRLAGAEVRGLRHHYWHLGPDIARTLRFHEEAGFSYDTSIAFNERSGFRRSVALPFLPYDDVLARPLRTVQVPSFSMDAGVFSTAVDVDGAVDQVMGLVDAIAAGGGVGAINWHAEASAPRGALLRPWALAYQEIVRRLVARPEIWVAPLAEIDGWWRGRAAAVESGGDT